VLILCFDHQLGAPVGSRLGLGQQHCPVDGLGGLELARWRAEPDLTGRIVRVAMLPIWRLEHCAAHDRSRYQPKLGAALPRPHSRRLAALLGRRQVVVPDPCPALSALRSVEPVPVYLHGYDASWPFAPPGSPGAVST
jgi:hypothetical protein